MKIRVQDGLPYVAATLTYRGQWVTLENTLLDTGSAGTIFSADKAGSIGLEYEPEDTVHRIRGVGGAEFVFSKQIDRLALDELAVTDFVIEVGAMDYGFELDGIIGLDFLMQVGALVDLTSREVRSARK